jgi:uncharacterized protein (DUF427 family)
VRVAGARTTQQERDVMTIDDHPIRIVSSDRRFRIHAGGRVIADTTNALILHEASYPGVVYIPREDVDMQLLRRTDHKTRCPYKGDASYYSIHTSAGVIENAAWTYEKPYPGVAMIAERLAFYPDRVSISEHHTD